jgi:hypothetical protein
VEKASHRLLVALVHFGGVATVKGRCMGFNANVVRTWHVSHPATAEPLATRREGKSTDLSY